MKYITVPQPFLPKNPLTDEASTESFPFSKSCRIALTMVANKKEADILSILDVRTKIDRAQAGEVVELTDDEWRILEKEFRRPDPSSFGTVWLFSAETHIRAVLEATNAKPS